MDNGVWTVGEQKDGKVFVESSDFTHDVRLYVDGDFADTEQQIEYAQFIANKLNGE